MCVREGRESERARAMGLSLEKKSDRTAGVGVQRKRQQNGVEG